MRPKNPLVLCLFVAFLFARPLCVAASPDSSPTIVIDGTRLSSDVPALVSGDHVLVPLRGVFEQFGALVSFDETTGWATASLNGTTVAVAVGSRNARINGEPKAMDVAAREIAGRVMIPLRFVAQALGVSVDYDAQSSTVVIVSGFKQGSFAAYAGGPVSTVASRVAPSVENMRPASGEIIGSQYPSIYARFNGGTSAVNPSTVQMQVDGIDVTDQSTISSAYVSYTPLTALQSGLHNVYVTGQAEDGTPFTQSWVFRVDAGSSSDYTIGSYGGAGFGSSDLGFGWPWFPRFHFSPPGFSVFTPGPLFFVSGGVIEVIFVSRFFPFGNGFFTITGCPGQFALTPWVGNPGFFWGFMQVPFGMSAHNAMIAAHFTMADGRQVLVRATAPVEIEGQRTSLPSSLRYAVLPRLVNRPPSPEHLVVFARTEPRSFQNSRMPAPSSLETTSIRAGLVEGSQLPILPHMPMSPHFPVMTHLPGFTRPAPVLRPAPVIRPAQVIVPAIPFSQWQVFGPNHPAVPAPVAKPH